MEEVLGIKEVTIDKKGRITIPADFNITEGEKLIIMKNKDYLEIKNYEEVINTLKELKEKINNPPSLELLQIYQSRVNLITLSAQNKVVVDKQKRINIGVELVRDYNLNTSVVLEGTLDSFRIWHPDVFNEYKNYSINKVTRK